MDEGYTAPEYVPISIVKSMSGVPRFGHPKDFSLLLSSDSGEQTNYALGTIFIGALLFAFFITWAILLLVFMFLGPRKVGFMAGFKMKRPFNPMEKYRTPLIVRSIFLFSCLVVISMAIITSFVIGFRDLHHSTKELSMSVDKLHFLAEEGKDRTISLLGLGRNSANLRDLIVNELRIDQFCTNSDLDVLAGAPINTYRNTLVQDLYEMKDFGDANFTELYEDVLVKVDLYRERLDTFLSAYGVKQWHIWSVAVVFTSIPFFMMLGTILTWCGIHLSGLTCLNTWFLLPVFLVIVMITWSLVSLISLGSVMNADFCTGGVEGYTSPDVTSMNIAARLLSDDPELLESVNYWVGGCPASGFPSINHLDDYVGGLNSTISSIQTLAESMDNVTLDEMLNICGKDFTAIRAYLDFMTRDYEDLIFNATKTGDLLKCESMNMIYVDAVHDTLCADVPKELVWAFSTLLILVFFAMIMITLRSSWLEVIDDSEIVIPNQSSSGRMIEPDNLDDSYFNDSPDPPRRSKPRQLTGEISPTGDIQFANSPGRIPQAIDDLEGSAADDGKPTAKKGNGNDSHSSLSQDPEDLEQALDDMLKSDDEASAGGGNLSPLLNEPDEDKKKGSWFG